MSLLLGLGLDLGFGGKVFAALPANTVAPSISGIQTAGQTLAVSNGAWSRPVTSYAFQWKRNGTDIAGATAQTYVLQSADAGQAISCTVMATNGAGSGSATSAAVTPAAALTISGAPGTDAVVGATWSFVPTVSGGHTPYSFMATGVPSWATFDAATGGVSGTPASGDVGAASGVVISAHDANGLTASLASFDVTVSEAIPAPVIILASNLGASGLSYTDTATAGATEGALVAAISVQADGALQTFVDSTGAAWTKVMEASDHAQVALYKRMVGSHPIVANETTFTITNEYAQSTVVLYVINVPAATGIPTTADGAGHQVGDANDGDLGLGDSFPLSVPSPTDASSYQVAAYATWTVSADFPGFGSDESWVQLAKMQDAHNNQAGLCVGYRKGGGTGPQDPTGLAVAAGGFTFNMFGWAELTAPEGGASSASGGGGGGGDGGAISSLSQLVSVLNAGVTANGGKTYTLDAIDFGTINLLNYNFSANPITFAGQEGTTAQSVALSGCHGLRFKDFQVTSYSSSTGAAISINNGCTDVVFDRVHMDSGAPDGSPANADGISVRNGAGADANIQFIGRRDANLPDLKGFGIGVSCIQSNGALFKDLTITNNGVDGVDIFGSMNCTVDGCLGYNFFSNIAAGDHPDWIQWADYEGVRGANILVQNCGFFVADGQQPQGYFGGSVDGVTVQDCWVIGGIYNSFSASNSTNILFRDNFGQSTPEFGSRVMIRGGSDTGTITKCTVAAVIDYTEPADPDHGQPDPIPNTNITIADDNVIIGTRELGDYTDLDAWLATHPNARARLT